MLRFHCTYHYYDLIYTFGISKGSIQRTYMLCTQFLQEQYGWVLRAGSAVSVAGYQCKNMYM